MFKPSKLVDQLGQAALIPPKAIEQRAQQIYLERQFKGIPGTSVSDWIEAKRQLTEEYQHSGNWTHKAFSFINRPLIWTEKRVVEPVANWIDRADFFRIAEKFCPLIEAVGVIAIPIFILISTQQYEEFKQQVERNALAQKAVKSYLNQLSTTFLDGDLEKNERLRKVTRASTLALLSDRNLSGEQKGQVIGYLLDLGLIQGTKEDFKQNQKTQFKPPLISLQGANLYNVYLGGSTLSNANLRDAGLGGSTLNDADLSNPRLSSSTLSNADLSNAEVIRANLYGANLRSAYLIDADMTSVEGWTTEQLGQAKLCRVQLPRGAGLDANRDCKSLDNVFCILSQDYLDPETIHSYTADKLIR